MKFARFSHIALLVLFPKVSNSQAIVPNGGFEDYINKGHSRYWTQAVGEFNHFYHSDISTANGGAANGRGYHCLCMYGMEPNEFMHVALSKKLEANKKYLLTMNVRMSNVNDEVHKNDLPKRLKRLDWYFTSIPLNVLYKLFITAEPSASFDFLYPQSTGWVKLSAEYNATGDEQFLTIGNITKIYDKIKRDEKLDSLYQLYLNLDNKEKAEKDSVRAKYIVELDEYKLTNTDEYSMNPYVESKRKRKRRAEKRYQEQIEKNKEVGNKINDGQIIVKKKYYKIKEKYTYLIEEEKKNFAMNICFDDVMITEMEGINTESVKSISQTKAIEGNTIVLKDIRFNTDKYDLLDEGINQLTEVVSWLKLNSTIQIQISGHTDNTGDEKHNIELSTNRAKAVVDYFTKNGIDVSRMKYMGYGSSYALADNSSELGKALNRRVELTILKVD